MSAPMTMEVMTRGVDMPVKKIRKGMAIEARIEPREMKSKRATVMMNSSNAIRQGIGATARKTPRAVATPLPP